jgi:3',5'-cyclic AMP phosphodiesterase CpdA
MRRRTIALILLAALIGGSAADAQPPEESAVLVGAGDIAGCSLSGDEATAALLDTIPGTVFTAGDNVYPSGALDEFRHCYDPTWGRHKNRTLPALGNHDYATKGAAGYFAYFGRRATPFGLRYYLAKRGSWNIIILDSNIDGRIESAQGKWLRQTLAENPAACTLAIWHHPLFASHAQTDQPRDLRALWEMLYAAGADVIINGHVHAYERFAPLNPDGQPDPSGIRQFIVGTGGASLAKAPRRTHPYSEVWDVSTWGVLKLTLYPTRYEWTFVPAAGGTFTDSGSAACRLPPVLADPTR